MCLVYKGGEEYEPELNLSYHELADHYHMVASPAGVRKPRDKPHVENGVQNVERWMLALLRNGETCSVLPESIPLRWVKFLSNGNIIANDIPFVTFRMN